MITTVVVFLAILSLLVLVHEFGHYIVGKKAGIGILEFALGLPFTKPLWKKKLRSGMQVALYPVLFGGFVRLLGEEGPASAQASAGQGKHFYQTSVWQRIGVVVAGVAMNFLLAVALFYLFLAVSGFKVLLPKLLDYSFLSPHRTHVIITSVQKDTPAAAAGLKVGDVLLSVDGDTFSKISDFQAYTKSRSGEKITLLTADYTLQTRQERSIVPRKDPPPGQGPLGVAIGQGVVLSYQTPWQKLFSGVNYAADMLVYNLKFLGHLVTFAAKTGDATPLTESVSGPVGIASAVGTILDLGGKQALVALFNFVGLLSLSLAFMNILPFPALDGGKLAILLVEALFGKKLAAKNENLINQIGMAFLLALIVLISYNDLKKVFER